MLLTICAVTGTVLAASALLAWGLLHRPDPALVERNRQRWGGQQR